LSDKSGSTTGQISIPPFNSLGYITGSLLAPALRTAPRQRRAVALVWMAVLTATIPLRGHGLMIVVFT
jgi:hypothetical protein